MKNAPALRTLLLALLLTAAGLLQPAPAAAEKLLIFAASSLREAFTSLGREFEARHPGTLVVLNFAGSQTLAAQIEHGAAADLFAAANDEVMAPLYRRQEIDAPATFAGNELILIVARDAADALPDFRAAATPGRMLAIGAPQVPVGIYTRELLAALERDPAYGPGFVAALRRNVTSEETNDKAIVAKVILGEVDAGIVYRTDLTPQLAGRLISRPLPAAHRPAIRYPIAQLRRAPQAALGARFLDFLFSAAGRGILSDQGFIPYGQTNAAAR